MLIDTHAHLYEDEFLSDRTEMLTRFKEVQGAYVLLPNIDVASIPKMYALNEKHRNCFPMMGLHPSYVKEDWQVQLEVIRTELFKEPDKFIAVGEIGIDLYWDKTFVEAQKTVFREQIRWAKALKKPIAIHVREAFDEVFSILDEENTIELSGVFHCFTGHEQQAKKVLSYGGFKLGIGGVVTYKNAKIVNVLEKIPLHHIVLETDAPYLAPSPHRGKRNESSFIAHVCEKLSEVYALSYEEIASITANNASELFQIEEYLNRNA